MPEHNHATHKQEASGPSWKMPLAIGVAAVAGAVILAPYELPIIGVGSADLALESITAMHGSGLGTGLAGGINSMLSAVPAFGPALAEGGMFAALASGVVGIGGVMLGNHMQKSEDGTKKFSYGKLVKTAALITSALIALPSILSAISVGLVYLTAALGNHVLAGSAVGMLSGTIGSMGGALSGPSLATGASAALPHLLTCGTALVPALVTAGMAGKDPQFETFEARMQPSPEPSQNPHYTDGSIVARIQTNTPIVAGQPCDARLTLTHKDGRPVAASELSVNYTEKMHLFVVDQSLKDYHHIHPTPTGTPGEFTFSFTPHTPNTYNAWTDVTLLRDDKNHRLKSSMPSALERNVRAYVANGSTEARAGGLVFSWKSSRLRKDTPSVVEVTVTDPMGKPVTDLKPVMGAFAHLVGFSADGKSIIHTHPMGAPPQGPDAKGGPTLRFHVEPDFNGPAQFYLQVNHGGKDTYAGFGQQVSPALLTSRNVAAREQGHANHASI